MDAYLRHQGRRAALWFARAGRGWPSEGQRARWHPSYREGFDEGAEHARRNAPVWHVEIRETRPGCFVADVLEEDPWPSEATRKGLLGLPQHTTAEQPSMVEALQAARRWTDGETDRRARMLSERGELLWSPNEEREDDERSTEGGAQAGAPEDGKGRA